MAIKSYRDLDCYKNAIKAISPTEKIVEQSIRQKDRGLADQIREAAHSVSSNIAEGYGRKDNEKDFKRFLRISMGSANEVIARLESACASGYVDAKSYDDLASQWAVVGKQLNRLIQNWRTFPKS